MKTAHKQGLTLIELTVVLLIVSILASVAISVYTTFVQRARIARAKHEILELSLSATRYQTDLGVFPPSRSQSTGSFTYSARLIPGNGLLMLALTRGIVGTAGPTGLPLTGTVTTEPLWHGPYMDVNQAQLVDFARFAGSTAATTSTAITASTLPGDVCLADPWGRPYSYVNCNDYGLVAIPNPLRATLIVNSPFTGFYNPSTFQIYSAGPDGLTPPSPNAGLGRDDVNNFNSQ